MKDEFNPAEKLRNLSIAACIHATIQAYDFHRNPFRTYSQKLNDVCPLPLVEVVAASSHIEAALPAALLNLDKDKLNGVWHELWVQRVQIGVQHTQEADKHNLLSQGDTEYVNNELTLKARITNDPNSDINQNLDNGSWVTFKTHKAQTILVQQAPTYPDITARYNIVDITQLYQTNPQFAFEMLKQLFYLDTQTNVVRSAILNINAHSTPEDQIIPSFMTQIATMNEVEAKKQLSGLLTLKNTVQFIYDFNPLWKYESDLFTDTPVDWPLLHHLDHHIVCTNNSQEKRERMTRIKAITEAVHMKNDKPVYHPLFPDAQEATIRFLSNPGLYPISLPQYGIRDEVINEIAKLCQKPPAKKPRLNAELFAILYNSLILSRNGIIDHKSELFDSFMGYILPEFEASAWRRLSQIQLT
ncbi:hypothetical protein HGB07_06270 [Candidatus Roizmanbacteria bacterium]|nr:hypothetical protein [Candidatus Roizmanbacteria bacterium]